MLYLRVITPEALSAAVLTLLTEEPGVAHLVQMRGAALDPPGDLITADVARESSDELVERLKALGVADRGAITMEAVDTVVSHAGRPRRWNRAGEL